MKSGKVLRQMMALIILALSASLLAVPILGQEDALQPGTAMGRLPSVPVKAEPSTRSATVATLEMGEVLDVLALDERSLWAQVEFGAVAGWVQTSSLINVDAPMPQPREYHGMAYDSESDRIVLYGGSGLTDTWAYDVSSNTWTYMAPAQFPPVGGGAVGQMVYDEQSDRIVLFLGVHGWPQPSDSLSDTWAYDFNTNTWTNMQPVTAPPSLIGAQMVYDSAADRVILFGGLDTASLMASRSVVFSNDTWVYDYDSNTWTKMDSESGPPGRNYPVMTYDAAADRVILFGGAATPADPASSVFPWEIVADTWAYDYTANTWEALEPAEAPSPRGYSAMVYDTTSNRSILFGGIEERRSGGEIQEAALGDTWAYDSAANTWTALNPAAFPSARGWHAMVYSSAANRMVLFSGCSQRNDCALETWIYDPPANVWTQAGP